MAVKIRLMRVGKKKQPTYRVVVADARSPRDGRIIETIGHYGPRQEPSFVQIDPDRALDWLRKGAQPTEQVQKLLTVTGVWETFTAERPNPGTKYDRRGHVTGRGPAKETVKAAKPVPAVAETPAEAPAAAAPEASETVEAPVAEEAEAPVAEAASAEATPAEETSAEETPVEATPAEEISE